MSKMKDLENCLKEKDRRIERLENRWITFRDSFVLFIIVVLALLFVYSFVTVGNNANLVSIEYANNSNEKVATFNDIAFPFTILVVFAVIGYLLLIKYIIEWLKSR